MCRRSFSTAGIALPSGITSVGITTAGESEKLRLLEVIVGRTARKWMDGRVILPAA